MKDRADLLRDILYPEEGGEIYALLDGASVPGLLPAFDEHKPEYECLYAGELTPELAEAVPYVVALPAQASFTSWVLNQGWGQHWGIFAESDSDIRAMRRHFSELLTVYDPDSKPLLFRYYDPRVMRVFLPTCNGGELAEMYGPARSFLMEDEDVAVLLRFRNRRGTLEKKQIPLDTARPK